MAKSEQAAQYRVFLSAAEPSGDRHCAALINALRRQYGGIAFVGVGGAKMAEAGCELLENTADNAAMIYKAFTQVGRYYRLIKRLRQYLHNNRVDLVVVCDSPAFNFHVAKAAKKAGIKTLFYVAPQLWAWAPWRIWKLRRTCEKLCCILPFEQQWFSQRGVDTTFVGNPLLDKLPSDLSLYRRDYRAFEPTRMTVAFMPGSRAAEVNSLWVPMQQIAVRLRHKYPQARFVTVAVDARRKEILQAMHIEGFACDYTVAAVSETAAKADFSIVTSGSATIEVAGVGCPMVIMFQSNRFLWHILGRWIVRTNYLSLVNILAGRELVPEFMPYFTSVEPIVERIEGLVEDRAQLSRLNRELIDLTQPLAGCKTSEKVAKIACGMLGIKG